MSVVHNLESLQDKAHDTKEAAKSTYNSAKVRAREGVCTFAERLPQTLWCDVQDTVSAKTDELKDKVGPSVQKPMPSP